MTPLVRSLHLVFVLFLVSFIAGCGEGGNSGVTYPPLKTVFTAKQIKEFEASSTSISEKLASAADPGSETSLNEAKAFALTLPNIESASVVNGNLEVKYSGGGREVWIENVPLSTIPADIPESFIQETKSISIINKGTVGNQKAALINTLHDDPNFSSHQKNFAGMKASLEATGFIVTEINGSAATPDKLGNLADYSVIIFNGHGCVSSDGTEYAMSTGKDWDYDDSILWTEDKCIKLTVDWGRSPDRGKRHLYGITGKFFRQKYEDHHFNSALFFNSACKGAKVDAFMQKMKEIGISAYAGWSWFDAVGNSTNERMIELMAGGKNLQEAYDALPLIYKREPFTAFISTFELSPYSDMDLMLGGTNIAHPEIRIDSPANGISIIDRRCVVKGQISPNSGYAFANIIVNGQSEVLSTNQDGSFEQAIGLRAGENVITIATRGDVEYQKSVVVSGNFSSDILFTTLWWNTDKSDIDFHLVPIEGADGAHDDCFFGNMTSTWGATLDVDDVNGYGPEHITARTVPSGTYLLYVHYYDTHDQTSPTVVNVSVSTNSQQSQIYSLSGNRRMATQDDRWNVCTIEFPSGRINIIDEFIPTAKSINLRIMLPRKK